MKIRECESTYAVCVCSYKAQEVVYILKFEPISLKQQCYLFSSQYYQMKCGFYSAQAKLHIGTILDLSH